MKKLIITLAILSLTSDLYAETTVQPHTSTTAQSINIYSDAVPQDMSQTQYQALMSQKTTMSKAAMSKQIASTAAREFRNKITYVWQPPIGKSGEKALVRVILNEYGEVISIVVSATDSAVKMSAEKAVRAAAPYPMPSDPDANRIAQRLTLQLNIK